MENLSEHAKHVLMQNEKEFERRLRGGDDDPGGGGFDWFSKLAITGVLLCVIGLGIESMIGRGEPKKEGGEGGEVVSTGNEKDSESIGGSTSVAKGSSSDPIGWTNSNSTSSSKTATTTRRRTNNNPKVALAKAIEKRDQAAMHYQKQLERFDTDQLDRFGGTRWQDVSRRIESASNASDVNTALILRSAADFEFAARELPKAAIEAMCNEAKSLASKEQFAAAAKVLDKAKAIDQRDSVVLATAKSISHAQFGFSGRIAEFARSSTIDCLATNAEGTRLYAGVNDSVIEYDLKLGEQLREFAGHSGDIKSIAIFDNGKKMVSGSADKTAIIWDLETDRQLHHLTESNVVNAVAASHDGRLVATAALSKNPQVWSVDSGKPVRRTKIDSWPWNSQIKSLVFDPSGKRLLGGGSSYNTHVWNVSNGRQKGILLANKNKHVLAMAFSPDGKSLVMLDAGGITVFDGKKLNSRLSIDLNVRKGAHVQISSDNQSFCVVDKVYDLHDGSLIRRADIPLSSCRSITVTPDLNRFVYATSRAIEVVLP